MSGAKRPMEVNMHVVGGKHWTKQEIRDGLNSQVKMPKPKALTPPAWLSDEAKKIFRRYAKDLLEFPAGIVSKLDIGTLARYCDMEVAYADASKHRSVWMETANRRLKDLAEASAAQDFCTEAQAKALSDRIDDARIAYGKAQEQVSFWTAQLSKAEKACRGCASAMGMTVADRCRLVVPKAAQPDPAANDPLEALRRKYQEAN